LHFLQKEKGQDKISCPLPLSLYEFLEFLDVGCLRAFFAFHNVELYPGAFLESLEAVTKNLGEMYENIRPIILLNETKTFCIVKPFYSSLCHALLLLFFCKKMFLPVQLRIIPLIFCEKLHNLQPMRTSYAFSG